MMDYGDHWGQDSLASIYSATDLVENAGDPYDQPDGALAGVGLGTYAEATLLYSGPTFVAGAGVGSWEPELPYGGQQVTPKTSFDEYGGGAMPAWAAGAPHVPHVEPPAEVGAAGEKGGGLLGWVPDLSIPGWGGGPAPGLTLPGLFDFGGAPELKLPDVTAPFDAAFDIGKMMPMMMMMMLFKD